MRSAETRLCACLLALLLGTLPAWCAGARYVTGPPFFTGRQGQPVVWQQSSLTYFTDPGDLSATVNHAAADALVAAAAAPWNVAIASITLGRGGALAEHVSSANTYLSSAGVIFPSDVASGNAAAVPIAVLYDTDGSITDLLLGVGASEPSSCHQNAVTESVDRFDPAGYIVHALIVLNGRCTGTAAAAQQEMRYKLERVFGRVLGLAWSQTNDNVFTGTPVPTYQQALRWPILHPIDILCGPYSYQCLPNPFTLRDDDLAGLVELYPVAAAGNGKQASLGAASGFTGAVFFPTQQGMGGVNVLLRRRYLNSSLKEPWFETSAVTGAQFRRADTSPFVAQGTDAMASMGATDPVYMGYYRVGWVPLLAPPSLNAMEISTETVNPLYASAYALGPDAMGTVAPSGSAPPPLLLPQVGANATLNSSLTVPDAASQCSSGSDGTPTLAATMDSSGSWSGLLCDYGHATYTAMPIRGGRTFTAEVTALDETGAASYGKAMPVLALFSPQDAPGSLPTFALSPSAFQSRASATTRLTASTVTGAASATLRLGIADQRGDGRPDFRFKARLLYADSVTPARVPEAGGNVTVSGMGFRAGNTLSVNGVAATVVSLSATSIVATVPTRAAANATAESAVDLVVTDLATGGQTAMRSVLTYGVMANPARVMKLLTAQAGSVYAGSAVPVPFAVQMLAADGVTPVPGEPVVFTASGGGTTFAACSAPVCTLTSDASGVVTSQVTPLAAGTVTLSAADGTLNQQGSFTVLARSAEVRILIGPPATGLANDVAQPLIIQVVDVAGNPMANRLVTYTTPVGAAIFNKCLAATCSQTTDASGVAVIRFTPSAAGALTVRTADGPTYADVTMTIGDNADTLQVLRAPTAQVNVGAGSSLVVRLARPSGAEANMPITFTASAGMTLSACTGSSCIVRTGPDGIAEMVFQMTQPGTYTIQATFASLVQSATITVVRPVPSLHVISAPTGTVAVNQVAATPFTVQLIAADGVTPLGGAQMSFGGAGDMVRLLSCNAGSCTLITDANGMLTSQIVPLRPGTITLDAVYLEASASASFTASGAPAILKILAQPGPSGVMLGQETTLTAQLVQGDGVTPIPGVYVAFQATAGSFVISRCGYSICSQPTDDQGKVSLPGMGFVAGMTTVTVSAGYFSLTQDITFPVRAPRPVMRLVAAPSGNVPVGSAAATPMTVQMLKPDGSTPMAGEPVTFTVTAGGASLSACAASPCTVVTDAQGLASTGLTVTAAGAVTVIAADGAANQPATLTGVALPDVLRLLSAPANGTPVGSAAADLFRVRALLADGTTPAAGRSIAVSVTGGFAVLAACGGASACTLTADASGMVATAVTPQAETPITLRADDAGVSVTANFSAVQPPNRLVLVSAPADGAYPGVTAATAFAVRLLAPDGTTALPRQAVTLAVSGATLDLCGAATCAATTDANGGVTSGVTPAQPGTIALSATAGAVSLTASFQAVARPDTLTLVGTPADGSVAGTATSGAFAVLVRHGDGTLASGISVTVSVTNTNGRLTACGAARCVLTTDANGLAASTVVPLAAGPVALLAVDGALSVSASFQAAPRPDTIALVTVPADGSPSGRAASVPFSVRVLHGDGSTAPGISVTLSVTNGSGTLTACGLARCTVQADANGTASTQVVPAAAGLVALLAEDGAVQVSASFQAGLPPDTLALVTVPADGSPVGQPGAAPFAVRVLHGDGSTAPGVSITLSVTNANGTLTACGAARCVVVTGADGVASSAVVARAAGAVALLAEDGALSVTAQYRAAALPDSLQLVSVPADGSFAGDVAAQPFAVHVLAGDGSAAAGRSVVFTAQGADLTGCATPCTVTADTNGFAAVSVRPRAAGTVQLTAADGNVTLAAGFTAAQHPDTLAVISTPADGAAVGVPAAQPFAVRLRHWDATAVAGASVVFSVTQGQASLSGCAASCSVTTDAQGNASVTVTPGAAGTIGLRAAAGALPVDVAFRATALPDSMRVVSQPADGALVGDAAVQPFAVEVRNALGALTAGVPVVLSVAAGSAHFVACGLARCSLLSDAQGRVQSAVVPDAAGSVGLQGAEAADTGVAATAAFVAAFRPDRLRVMTGLPSTSFVGDVLTTTVQATLADGVSAAAARTVSFSASGGALLSCGSSVCATVTDAQGIASMQVRANAPGTLTVQASEPAGVGIPGSNIVSSSTQVANRPDVLTLVSSPASVRVSITAVTAFAVRLTLADGTPVAGAGLAISAAGAGAVALPGCPALPCTAATDANGTVSMQVTGVAPGAVTLTVQAAAATGAASVSAMLLVEPDVKTILAGTGTTYIAAGQIVGRPLAVTLVRNGQPAVSEAVTWSAGAGAQVDRAATMTDAQGGAGVGVVFGPLADGASAAVTACAWMQVCTAFAGVGVGDARWQLALVAGAQQAANGSPYGTLTARVTDGAGHVVAGVSVVVHQTVVARSQPCPAQGRCPAAPVLATEVRALTSALDGTVLIAPLSVEDQASETRVLLSAGSNAAAATVLTRQP